MTKKKNIYEQNARKKALTGLGSTAEANAETKGDFRKTLAYTGRDILIGGLGGSLAGAVTGRISLVLGALVTGVGHFLGSPTTAMFGVGMMASGGYQTIAGSMNGTEKDGIEGVKERFGNFQSNLQRQLFLDKIKPKKKPVENADESTNGVEQVQYIQHPQNDSLDYTETNKLEQQLQDSAKQFENEVNGMEGMEGILDDPLY